MAVRRKQPTATPSEPVSVLSSNQDVNKIVQDTFGLNTKAIENDLSISSSEQKAKEVVIPQMIKDPKKTTETKKSITETIKYKEDGFTDKLELNQAKVKVIGLKDVRTMLGDRKLLVEKNKVYHVDQEFADFLMKIGAVK